MDPYRVAGIHVVVVCVVVAVGAVRLATVVAQLASPRCHSARRGDSVVHELCASLEELVCGHAFLRVAGLRDVCPKVPLSIRAGHVLSVGDNWLMADSLAEVFICLGVLFFESDIFY